MLLLHTWDLSWRSLLGTKMHFTVTLFWLLALFKVVEDQELFTPRPPILDVGRYCREHLWFNKRQHRLCELHPNLVPSVKEGAIEGIQECRYHFRHKRWNCPLSNITAVFGSNRLRTRNREMAYLQSMVSAGIMFHVTRSCESGDVFDCGCDTRYPQVNPPGDWTWGGCSDNIRYGMYFTRQFVDASKEGERSFDAMTKHNYEAGRQLIVNNMGKKCKCYGVSASCTSRVCWNSMPKLREISSMLTEKHTRAHHVNYSKKKAKLVPIQERERHTKQDLVYLMPSPDYCEANRRHGSVGTRGRLCNKTSTGVGGCELMCCGRGYQTMIRTVTESCHCRFYWCCYVECETCKRQEELQLCN
ncbi:protein Wnt-4-like [Apostichopus japonicus]|uniref:Protein Wnt n=2 Tax=Stichopus japonicus TaxID=307972 RepID=A0A2R2WVD6_STIJA|nr:Wnt4 [Apostichopus japonicus]